MHLLSNRALPLSVYECRQLFCGNCLLLSDLYVLRMDVVCFGPDFSFCVSSLWEVVLIMFIGSGMIMSSVS